jgi:hypothetical protein
LGINFAFEALHLKGLIQAQFDGGHRSTAMGPSHRMEPCLAGRSGGYPARARVSDLKR